MTESTPRDATPDEREHSGVFPTAALDGPGPHQEEPPRRRLPAAVVVLATGLAPGVLAGALIAGLLFFLNFHWRTDLGPWLRTVALYSALVGGGGLALQLPFLWGAPERARRWLPWSLSLTFLALGLLSWWHASHLALYLPPGINRRLIKAGLLLLSAALLGLLIALSHSLKRRSYSLRSRLSLLALCLVAISVVVERREAYEALTETPPRPFFAETPTDPQTVVVIGVSALSLDVLLPLAEQGRLPFFAELLRDGAVGRMGSLKPSRSEPSWWSLATGALPYQLGESGARRYAADFIEPGETFRLTPVGLAFERWGVAGGALPTSQDAPPVPSVWQLLRRQGSFARVIGFATEPELLVDLVLEGGSTDAVTGSPQVDLTGESKNPAAKVLADAAQSRRDALLSAMNADDLAVAEADGQRIALALLELRDAPDDQNGLVFARLDGLAPISQQTYGAFARVELRGLRQQNLVESSARLVAYYSLVDDWLRELWQVLQERSAGSASLVVVSPFGVSASSSLWDVWRAVWPERLLTGRLEDGADGVLLARGPVWRTVRLEEAAALDLAPTLAYLFDLPVAQDLAGEVLIRALRPDFLREHPLRYVPSYGRLPAPPRTSFGFRPSAAVRRGSEGLESDGLGPDGGSAESPESTVP